MFGYLGRLFLIPTCKKQGSEKFRQLAYVAVVGPTYCMQFLRRFSCSSCAGLVPRIPWFSFT